MSETNHNTLLYEKMKAEQDKYRDWLQFNFESVNGLISEYTIPGQCS